MAVEILTKPLDRWDLIAERVYGVPDLAWAIAEANPELAGDLILPAGITLSIPELNTLRRPLTAANPAREDDGDFLPLLADDSPAPIESTGGGVVGNFVPLEAVGVTVAPLFNGVVPVGHLPPYPTLASLNGLSAEVINTALALKVDTSTYTAAIALKADASAVATALALKADASAVATALGLKVDTSTYTAGLGTKVDTSTYTAGLGTKVDTSTYTAGLGTKVDTSTYTAAIALKLDASARNAASGVAGLNASSLIDINQLPLGSLFAFTASATFRGGTTPAIGVSLTQAGVDASGQPRYWLVNAAATAGNRLKSLTVASNGNIIFGHHADDGTAGVQVELTASGNLLTAGTVRPGSGNVAFSGAQFLPGAIYFRTDILGDGGSGCLTYSDGVANGWRRVSNGSLVTDTDPGIATTSEKTINFTTANAQGGFIQVAHGINAAKIVSVTVIVNWTAVSWIGANYTHNAGRQFQWDLGDSTTVSVINTSGNSASILSKPGKIYIRYTP